MFLTTKQKHKIRNIFTNNMSIDVNLSKAQLSKIFQSGGFLGPFLGKLAGLLKKVGISLAKNLLAPLASMTSASGI